MRTVLKGVCVHKKGLNECNTTWRVIMIVTDKVLVLILCLLSTSRVCKTDALRRTVEKLLGTENLVPSCFGWWW